MQALDVGVFLRGQRRMSRRALLGSALGVSASVLAACGQTAAPAQPTAPPAQAQAQASQPIQAAAPPTKKANAITYQTRDGVVTAFIRERYAAEFEKDTGIKVNIDAIPFSDYFKKVPVLAAGNQLGDVVFTWTYPWLPNWASKKMLRGIDDYVAADKYDLGKFYKGVIDGCRAVDNKLYGLPSVAHPSNVNLFFNKTLLQKAGVKPPDADSPNEIWKWDDLLTAAKAVTSVKDGKTEVWGYRFARGDYLSTTVNLRAFGSDLVSEDGKSSPAGNTQGKASYRYFYDLIYKHKVEAAPTDTTAGLGLEVFFASGKVGMVQDGTQLITTLGAIIKDSFEWGVFPWPVGPGGNRGGTVFGNVESVSTQAKEPAAGWEFIKYVCTQEVGVGKLLMGSGSPGARPDVFLDPRIVEKYPWYKVGDRIMREARAAPLPANYRTPEMFDVVGQVESEIWLDKVAPEDGAVKLQKVLEDILKQPP
jgi:multiple sugar transport system substrate-binding protein